MPNATRRSAARGNSSRRRSAPRRGKHPNTNNLLVDLAQSASRADDHVIISDLTLRPPIMVYNARPPRNLNNQIHFVRFTSSLLVNSSATAITETNILFTAAAFMQVGWLALFDQYCLDSVVVSVANQGAPSAAVTLPELVTNVDFDSISVIGNIATLRGYSNSNSCNLETGKALTRIINPANAPSVGGLNSSGVSKMWVDSAFQSVPFYGFRSIMSATPGGTYPILFTTTCVWAFRNTI